MSKIGRRECYLIRISSQNVERLAEQVNPALAEMGVPDEELVGAPLNHRELSQRLRQFYERTKIQAPSVMPEDFAETIMKAAET